MAKPASRGGQPQRTCIGCRSRRDQGDLVRIVRLADGRLDVGRTLPGRGAWLCRASAECFELAARRGGFARAFRLQVPVGQVEALRLELPGGPPR